MDEVLLRECEEVLGYRFKDESILVQALTHASSNSHDAPDNERLEFFGDAVVGMVICEHLFTRYPQYSEGRLTRMKSAVVSRSSLGYVARMMGMSKFIIVGPGMAKRKHLPNSLYANVFEAVIAAIYLDGGMDAAEKVILDLLESEIDAAEADKRYRNYKSILQHYTQREMQVTPSYKVVREEGPDHLKFFEVVAVIEETDYRSGWGRNKKEAEQRAAEETLKVLGVDAQEET
ncbi:MAG: ribonuclease III [Planctomycetes bacterium]|nr:ribonuclease III [Planctomycetota bacterium]